MKNTINIRKYQTNKIKLNSVHGIKKMSKEENRQLS